MASSSQSRQRGSQLAQMVYSSLVASARAQAAPSTAPSVSELEQLLVQRDGALMVAGEAFSDPALARTARLLLAAQARLDMARGYSLPMALERCRARRLWLAGDRTCAWCEQPILTLDHAEELGLRLVHHGCAHEFAEWANDGKSDEQIAMEQREQQREQRLATLRAIDAGEPADEGEEEAF